MHEEQNTSDAKKTWQSDFAESPKSKKKKKERKKKRRNLPSKTSHSEKVASYIHPTHFQRQGHIYCFGLTGAYGQLVTFDVHAGSE